MPFNFLDGLDALVDLLTLDFSKNSSSKSAVTKKSSKKSNTQQNYGVEAFF